MQITDDDDGNNKQPTATTDGGEGSSTPKKTEVDKSLQILAEAADVDALANKIANKNKKTTEDGVQPSQGSPSVDDDDASDEKEDSNSKSVADDSKEEEDGAKSDDKPGGDNEAVDHDTAAVESGKEEKNDTPSTARPTDAAIKEEVVEDTQEKKKTEEEPQPLPNERFFPKRPKRRQSGSSSFDDSSSLVYIDPNEYKQKFCIPKITKKKRSEEEYKAMELILKQGVTMGNSIEHDDDDDDDDEEGGGGGSKEGIAKNQGGQEGREEDQGQDATTTADADDTDGMMKSKEEEIHQMKLKLAELERRRSATAGGGGGGGGGVHKQVATGVPLRDTTQSSTLSAMLEAQQRRRRSSNAWETMSLTSFPMDSPNPFKDVIGSRQDFFTKGVGSVGGMTPIPDGGRQVLGADDIMNNMLNRRDNYSINDRLGMLNNMSDVELKKRMMEMVAGASAGGGSGGGGGMVGGGMMGMGGGGGDFGTTTAAAGGNKRKLDDAGSSPSSPNPGPKKSFLQRERIMDAEMRNHMMEALLSGSNANGPRSAGGGGGGSGDMNSMMNNRPNSSSSQFMNTPVESSMGVGFNNQDGMLMSQAQAMQQARMMAAKFPSLMSPNEGGGGGGLGVGGGGMMGGNMNMMMGMQNNMNNMGGYPGMSSTGDVNDSSFKKTSKTSSSATKTPKGKATPSASSKKKGKQKQSSKELVASVLASTGIDKPKRPFSAYNLFFQLEREFIKNEISEGRNPSDDPVIKDAMAHAEKEKEKGKDAKKTDDEKVPLNVENPVDKDELKAHIKKNEQSASRFYIDPLLPERYTQIKLDKYWYSIGHKQKRKHRKTEGGSVGFIELTKMVSARWKRIGKTDPDVKEYCQKLADLELVQYKVEMDAYKKAAKEAEIKIAMEEMESRPPVLIQGSAKLTAKKTSSATKKGSKKKKGKKAADDDNDDRPSTPHDANMNQQGYTGDMSSMSLLNMARFTDLAKFSGLNTPGFLSGLNTPGNNSIMPGFCGDAGQDVGRGLPPPPFGGDGADNNSSGAGNDVANRAGDRARMAAEMNEGHMNNGLMNDEEATMARVRMALQMGNTQMAEQLLKSLQEQNDHNMMQMASNFQTSRGGQSSGSSSQDDALAKLAKADARSRMQMEMLATGGGMSGSNQGGGFGSSMRSMMTNQQQGSFSSGGVGGNDDSRFDVEVDRFLSTLKKKIKDNRSMQMGGAADGGSMGTGNFSQAEQMMMMNMINRGNSGGSESRAEIMARMMRNMASGNARSGGSDMPEVSPEIMQEMMRRTMTASGGGNTTSPNNTMDNMTMPRPPFGTNDFQRQQGGSQGGGSGGGGGRGGNNNQWQV